MHSLCGADLAGPPGAPERRAPGQLLLTFLLALVAPAVAVTAPGAAHAQGRGEVLVSAAASLTDVLQRLAPIYEQQTGERLVLNLAASNTLARQIAAGARVDLFISADEAQLDAVAGQIAPGTRVDLLSNQLAVAVPADGRSAIRRARDLAAPSVRRIAIGDPNGVPAGVYARQYLQRAGLWDALAAKIIPSGSVRLALAAVENGAADAAIVYRTDVASARRTRVAFLVPPADGPRIVYPAAVIAGGRNTAGARRFLDFLRGAEASRVFAEAGFVPLAAAAGAGASGRARD